MKRLLLFLFCFGSFFASNAQFPATNLKQNFKWGVALGTRDSTAYGANDSLVVVINRQGRMMYRSTDGYWKVLANAASSDFVPYTGATTNVNLGTNRLTARSLRMDSVIANGSGGAVFVTNSGNTAFSYGAGGSSEVTFNGFAGYNANRASSYTARSFVTKNDMDSGLTANRLPVIAWGNSLTFGFGATSTDSTYPAQASRLSGYNFVNKGISGETPAQINARVYAESADTLLFPSVFWAMENISDTAQMTNQLDSFVAKINHNRWVAVAPILRSGNPIGNSAYNQQRKWTADAFRRYGNHIIDMHDWLLNFGDGSAGDNTDVANRVIPRSLRVDNIHLNDKGYRIVAQRILQQLNMFTQGNQTYTNGVSISAQQGSPIINGNGLFQWKTNNHSYINSFSATTPFLGGDTLTIQNSAGVVNIAPSTNSSIRLGFLPIRTTVPTSVMVRGSEIDTSRISSVLLGNITGTSGDITVTNGTNAVIGQNVNLTLATVSTTAGTFGSATKVPQFTYDAKGRILGANEQDILIPIAAVTGLSTQLASKAAISGQQFTGLLATTAGNGVVIGGGSFLGGISPSATRGVLQVTGSTDQFVTMGANGYFLGSASLMRILGNTGREFDIVADNTMAFKIFNTTRNVVIQNGGSFVDSTAYRLQVGGSVRSTGGYFAVNGLFQSIGANANIALRANGSGEARINESNGGALKFYGGGASELFTANTNGTVSNTANQNSAWALSTTNNGSTNANGLLVTLGASSTGLGLQIVKDATALFTVGNSGGVTAQRGNFTSLRLNKDSVSQTTTNTQVLTIDTASGRVQRNTLTSGTYTPTLTNATNISTSTAWGSQFMRVGNVVTVSGRVVLTPTATSTLTVLRMTLPVATTMTGSADLSGTMAAGDAGQSSGRVFGETGTNTAEFRFNSPSGAGSQEVTFVFTYVIK